MIDYQGVVVVVLEVDNAKVSTHQIEGLHFIFLYFFSVVLSVPIPVDLAMTHALPYHRWFALFVCPPQRVLEPG